MSSTLQVDNITNSAGTGAPNFPFGLSGGGVWTSFSVTGTWTSNTTYTGFYNIQGKNLLIRVGLILSGAPNSAVLSVSVPSGFTLDTSKMTNTTDDSLGQSFIDVGGTPTMGITGIASGNPTQIVPSYFAVASGLITLDQITDTAPVTFGTGNYISFGISIPIL